MIRVLIAEDEDIERNALRTLINQNYKGEITIVGEAVNGKEAIDLTNSLNPHIVLIDIHMPKVNGLEAAEKIRKDAPETIIVIVTAYSTFEYARQAIKIGVQDYLIKPYSIASLTEMMDDAVSKLNAALVARQQNRRVEERLLFMREQVKKLSSNTENIETEMPRDLIEEIQNYIKCNYSQQITLEDISKLIGLSKYHLSRMFSEKVGMGIKEFSIDFRIKRAQDLLSKGMPVAEVAYSIGFNDPNYFSKLFKKYIGCTPSCYQKRN